jgi:ribulose-phosphate 3-epimerase
VIPAGVHVAPSILAADAARLADQVVEVVAAGARMIHVDVMDGHFVPPITFGAQTVAALRGHVGPDVVLDVHLMVDQPVQHIAAFASAGADVITLHVEATPHLHYALGAVAEHGCLAGAALCPATPPETIADVADLIDVALCMTVDPGWGGQAFLERSPDRLRRLRPFLSAEACIEVDGGIDLVTGPSCVEAGATLLVAGSAIFGAPSPGEAFVELATRAAAAAQPTEMHVG